MTWRVLVFLSLFLLGLKGAATARDGAGPVEVEVRGVAGAPLANVEAALTPPPMGVRDSQVDPRWLERFRQQIPERARQALEPFGFYHAEVSTDVEREDGRLRLIVDIRPGEPVRLSSVVVQIEGAGARRSALQRLVREFPLRPGDILDHQLYEEGKGALEGRALELGYLDAFFPVHEIRVHLGERRAEIELVLQTGPRYRFGEATITGAPQYPERFLRRYLAFIPEEDAFSFAKLGQTQLNFLDSDRFREVVVTPLREAAADLAVPVEILLSPSPSRRLRPGIGYGTDTGARFSFSYNDLNVRDLGHEFTAEIVAAELKQSAGVSYIIPSYRNVDSHTALRLGFDRENLDIYDTQTVFAEIERARAFGRGRQGSVYLRLQQEDFSIGEEDSTSRLVLPGIRFSRRRYRDPVRPQEGYQFSLEARGTHQVIGSDTGLAQLLAAGNFLLPLPGRFSLFTRLNSGMTIQNEPLREIPPSLRFFAGGDRSVRGYAYQSIGVRDAAGDVVGGKNLLVGSIELICDLWENWGVALFYDAGDAFNSFSSIDWRQSAGTGIRWYTLVGPINIDLARQIGEPDPSFRLHVSLGFGW